MSTDQKYDLVVLGGGPAGYAAAIRAGQLGKHVACIEMERAGGTCLNWGCIPTKALLKSAELFRSIQHADAFGIKVPQPDFDFSAVMDRSRGVSDRMAKGIEFLFKKSKVDYLVGKGRVIAPGMVEIFEGEKQGSMIQADRILIATGCLPRRIPGVDVDGKRVFTSREMLANRTLPKSLVVVGAGAIGVEFAYFFNSFGVKVTLVEMLDQILPVEDAEVAQAVTRSFKKQGMAVHVSTKVENISVKKHSVSMELVSGDRREVVEADMLLEAIGVIPNLDGVLSGRLKPELERGYLKVDEQYETTVPGVFAAGDIIGPPWLAHVATYEAIQAVNGMFVEGFKPKKVHLFPGCTYCMPQVASVGMTEKKVKESGVEYTVGKYPYSASGKAVAVDQTEGFVKIITSKAHGEILGAHIVGYDATELIGEYGLAMSMEGTVDDVHHTIHAHPTLGEMLGEAAGVVLGEAVHV